MINPYIIGRLLRVVAMKVMATAITTTLQWPGRSTADESACCCYCCCCWRRSAAIKSSDCSIIATRLMCKLLVWPGRLTADARCSPPAVSSCGLLVSNLMRRFPSGRRWLPSNRRQ